MTTLTPGLTKLKDLIEGAEKMDMARLADFVSEANISIADLEPYADFNHPVEDGYGRKLAYMGKHFEIMVMSWAPGDYSSVHDHGYTTWGAVQVFGNVMHQIFTIKNDVFKLSRKEILTNGTIIKVNNPLIHQMGNITSDPYFTLHIYGDDVYEGDVTADTRIFELETGLIKRTTGGAFFNLPDEDVYDIERMPEIGHQTFVHQAAILLQYYQRYTENKAEDLSRVLVEKLTYCNH